MRKIILIVMAVLFLAGCVKPCTMTVGEIEQIAWTYFNDCKNKPEPEEPLYTGTMRDWFTYRGVGRIEMDNGELVSVHYTEMCYPFHPRGNVKVKFDLNDKWAVNIKEIL